MDQATAINTTSRADLLIQARGLAQLHGCGWLRRVLDAAGVELLSKVPTAVLHFIVRHDADLVPDFV